MEHLLEVYGYPALFIGTFLEGETPVIVASFLAHRGYLALPMVMLVAFAATVASDQIFFQLGRSRGRAYLASRPTWQEKAVRVERLIVRHGVLLILGFRFLYGLRIVAPFVLGMSRLSRSRFVALNVVGAAGWTLTVTMVGYSIGSVLARIVEDLRRHEVMVVFTILLVSALAWLVYFVRRAWLRRHAAGP